MKKKIVRLSALFTMMILSLVGCKKDSRTDDGVADVYIKSVLYDGEPVFGLVHYVMGYSAITSVTVSMPDQTVDQLYAYDTNNIVFYSEPTPMNGSYSSVVPAKGTYSYGVKFTDGVEKVVTDELESAYLLPPDITSISKSLDGSKINIKWGPLAGVDSYQFNISKAGTVVFTSQVFTITTNDNYIDPPISLIPSYSPGSYTIELNAYKFQSNNNGKIQAISSASAEVDL